MSKLQPAPRPLRLISPEAPQYFEKLAKRVNVAAVADLTQTISNPPTQAQVQAVQNKVNEMLAAFRAAETMGS